MGLRNFNIKVIGLCLLIGLSAAGFFWTFDNAGLLVTNRALAFLWVVAIVSLIYVVRKTNRDLKMFLSSMQYEDDMLIFNQEKGAAFDGLYEEMNRIVGIVATAKEDREVQHQYFLNLVRHVPVGMLAIDQKGDVEICNHAALELLERETFRNTKDIEGMLGLDLLTMKSGEQITRKVHVKGNVRSLHIRASGFRKVKDPVLLLSIQDIQQQLDENEIVAWQKLIRVLTHEIINSASPISLLSMSLLKEVEAQQLDPIFRQGLEAIHNRGEGMKQFVENYKSIASPPQPVFTSLTISSLLHDTRILMEPELDDVDVQVAIDQDGEIQADQALLEQVLINLMKNSNYALEGRDKKTIRLIGRKKGDRAEIVVEDNGRGFDGDIEQIFLPFYTTREGGSGIGLSLSRQIMVAHGGRIYAEEDKGITRFTLQL